MDYQTLKGLVIIWELCIIALPPLIVCVILEEKEKRRIKKANRLMKHRKRAFAAECERAGRKMMNEDNIHKILKQHPKNQTIKYTGYFSGESVEL